MVRWRWVVLAVWLVLLVVVGGLLAPKAPKALKGGGFIDPDSESAKAAAMGEAMFDAAKPGAADEIAAELIVLGRSSVAR